MVIDSFGIGILAYIIIAIASAMHLYFFYFICGYVARMVEEYPIKIFIIVPAITASVMIVVSVIWSGNDSVFDALVRIFFPLAKLCFTPLGF